MSVSINQYVSNSLLIPKVYLFIMFALHSCGGTRNIEIHTVKGVVEILDISKSKIQSILDEDFNRIDVNYFLSDCDMYKYVAKNSLIVVQQLIYTECDNLKFIEVELRKQFEQAEDEVIKGFSDRITMVSGKDDFLPTKEFVILDEKIILSLKSLSEEMTLIRVEKQL